MTKEEKLEAIYKEMANKGVSFGCRYKFIKKYQYCDWAWFEPWDIITLCKRDAKYEDSFLTTFFRDIALIKKDVYDYVEIIWHPVMIWDVIKRIKANREISYWEYLVKLLGQLSRPWLWRELGLSINEQSDECINYVYSLISSKSME